MASLQSLTLQSAAAGLDAKRMQAVVPLPWLQLSPQAAKNGSGSLSLKTRLLILCFEKRCFGLMLTTGAVESCQINIFS